MKKFASAIAAISCTLVLLVTTGASTAPAARGTGHSHCC